MNVEFVEFDGKRYCNVDADLGRSIGILHFGHEISVTFVKDGDDWKFDGAWHVGVYEGTWGPGDEEDFELSWPGLLGKMRSEIARKEESNG